MRNQVLFAILIVSLALNVLFGSVIIQNFRYGGNAPLNTAVPGVTGNNISCNCSAVIEYYRSRLNSSCVYSTTGTEQSRKSAVLQGPAVLTSVNYIRRGPFVFGQTNQTGTMMNISAEILPGEGRVLVQTTPLMGIVFQDAANTAVGVAVNRTGADLSGTDVIISIESGGIIPAVDGPSAGALMTILVESAISQRALDHSVTLTGTISPDGKVGAIGGVIEKAQAAKDAGKTLLLLPQENAVLVTVTEQERDLGALHITEQVPQNTDAKDTIEKSIGIRVEYVNTIGDVERYMFR
jgi:hypothetical protein